MENLVESLPIYVRIVQGIKDAILNKELKEESQIASTTFLSKEYKINIATVNKAMNILVDEGLVYKKEASVCLLKLERSLNLSKKEEKYLRKGIL